MNFKDNLHDLIKDAHEFQYKEIGATSGENQRKKPKLYFTKIQWLIILLSLIVSYYNTKGFAYSFSGYMISGLSLFVGMFFTFLITLYDKFRSINFEKYRFNNSEEQYPIGQRLKNYFKKITVLSLYATIVSIVSIVLLSVNLLTDYFSLNTEKIQFTTHFKEIDFKLTFNVIIDFSYKSVTLYFLLDFLLIAIYIVSSFYDFMISEYNQVKLK